MASSPVERAKRAALTVGQRFSRDNGGADRGTQQLLALQWGRLAHAGIYLPLRDVEFRNTSQNGEDGILLYLMTLAGHGARRAVEMCAGDAIENNSSNLALHWDWDVLMLDGDEDLLERGRSFYARHQETYRVGPTIGREWITVENVNAILGRYGYTSDIDLLTIDMDGVDYWVLEAIDLTPRIIVVEYNNRIPAELAVTVPYSESFATDPWAGDGFFGASLAAFVKLLDGYRLVGANRQNTNAFFLRDDVAPDVPGATVHDCLTSRWARHQRERWPEIAAAGWVSV